MHISPEHITQKKHNRLRKKKLRSIGKVKMECIIIMSRKKEYIYKHNKKEQIFLNNGMCIE